MKPGVLVVRALVGFGFDRPGLALKNGFSLQLRHCKEGMLDVHTVCLALVKLLPHMGGQLRDPAHTMCPNLFLELLHVLLALLRDLAVLAKSKRQRWLGDGAVRLTR